MPKISKIYVRVLHDDIDKGYNAELMYSRKFLFIVEYQKEFIAPCIIMSNKDKTKLKIEVFYRGNYNHQRDKNVDYIVTGVSEEECEEALKNAIKSLINISIVKNNVIIILYDNGTIGYGNHRYNKNHPQIGIQFGLTYAIESCVGDNKVYSVYETYKGIEDNDRTIRHELNLWNKDSVIIPDTKENRIKLEQLYDALTLLKEQMNKFMSSSEDVLKFISSGIKLLN